MEQLNIQTLAIDKNEFVSSIITNSNGNVLLFKRKSTLRMDPGKYDFCSGHMKFGEIPMQSMLRELLEEIGIRYEQLTFMDKVADIETPHPKLKRTVTHLYYIVLDLPEEKINDMIGNVEEPELEDAEFLDNIEELRTKMIEEKDNFRMEYTDDMKMAINEVKKKINKRKQQKGVKECEEK